MKGALLVVSLVGLFVTPDAGRAQSIDLLRQGVVKVVPQSGSQTRTSAAGFIVRAEARAVFVVTASHVIEGADRVGVEFFHERRLYPARVLGLEGGDPRGLATLIVEDDVPANVMVLGINRDVDVGVGEAVTMIGFPASVGAPWAVTKGSIVGRRGKDIVFAGAVEAGNSGGPLIKGDQVVGLITQAQGQFAFATPSLIVQYSLESWGVTFGVRLRSAPTILHENELLPLFREKGFSHPNKDVTLFVGARSPVMESVFGRFRHEFTPRTVHEVPVVEDRATGLMWLRSGSDVEIRATTYSTKDIEIAIATAEKELNSTQHAGFANWRVPTIEELGSLLEGRATLRGSRSFKFLDDAFDYSHCVSADRVVYGGYDQPLGVSFDGGNLTIGMPARQYVFVCAVRSIASDEMRSPQVALPSVK
jgi:hypothetical protein